MIGAWPGQTYGTVSWNRGIEIFEKEQFPYHDKFYKTIRWGKDLQIWSTGVFCARWMVRERCKKK
jgi:hypothetical protein